MKQSVSFGFGALAKLPRVLARLRAKRVFLVTGNASYTASGLDAALRAALPADTILRFSEFSENPKIEDVAGGVAALRSDRFDVVVGAGGGSAIDMAKLVNLFAHQRVEPRQLLDRSAKLEHRGLPLVAIPTTAGSGSEATHFGVLYVDGVKHSIASPAMLPTFAIVDPALTRSLPPRLTAITGMDALAQAIESYWCVHSTEESKSYARRAISLVLDHLAAAVRRPSDVDRRAMSKAAHLAGRAINVSRTTGPHALSYALTAHYGIRHGHAVALTLGEFFVFNRGVSDRDVTDARGAGYVRGAIDDLAAQMGCRDAAECRSRLHELMHSIGLPTRLGELGISAGEAVNLVAENVNVERLRNNPRAMTAEQLHELVAGVC